MRSYVADRQRSDEARLRARIERATLDAELAATTNPAALTELVQTVWQGLSIRSKLGATREQLADAADLALTLINPLRHAPSGGPGGR